MAPILSTGLPAQWVLLGVLVGLRVVGFLTVISSTGIQIIPKLIAFRIARDRKRIVVWVGAGADIPDKQSHARSIALGL